MPTEQVDLGALAHKSASFTAINPLQRVPALVLDDGTVITESIAICRYFELLHPNPPLFGTRAQGRGDDRDVAAAAWSSICMLQVGHVFRNIASRHERDGGAAGAGMGGGEQAARHGLSARARQRAGGAPFAAGDRYSVADITGMIGIDFMKPAKLAVPES